MSDPRKQDDNALQVIVPVPADAPTPNFAHYKWGDPVSVEEYRRGGPMHFYNRRFEWADETGKKRKEFVPLSWCRDMTGKCAWRAKAPPDPPLYNEDQLADRPDTPVLIVEGEKTVRAAALLFPDYVVVTSYGGSKAAHKSPWDRCGGRHATIWGDNDGPGRAYAGDVIKLLQKAGAASVRLVPPLIGFLPGWDLADEMPAGCTVEQLRKMLEGAELLVDGPTDETETPDERPRLLIRHADPNLVAADLRDILADHGAFYDWGDLPVRIVESRAKGCVVSRPMLPDDVMRVAHTICRPWAWKQLPRGGGTIPVDVRLPRDIAAMYLTMQGEWNLLPFRGIAAAPMLRNNGTIHMAEGYDSESGMWCEGIPDLAGKLPDRPTREHAKASLLFLRNTFKTFPFADAAMVKGTGSKATTVDLSKGPSKDESAFLAALLTAVCRPSLPVAPGVLVRAAAMSGAGTGKGLLTRCICLIAFGREPHAVTSGANNEEMDKRISAVLLQSDPVLFFDNINRASISSDLLASIITERLAKVRILGKTQMAELNCSAFVIVTGNGVTVSEDLARRFIYIELDAHMEDPEDRAFVGDIRSYVAEHRAELLAHALTIWRWGRTSKDTKAGATLGGFEEWGRWVRDPLVSLGCADPVKRIKEIKDRDPRRQNMREVFAAWDKHHQENQISQSQLHEEVFRLINPANKSRQWLAAELGRLDGGRIGGFVFTRQPAADGHTGAVFRLTRQEGVFQKPSAPKNHHDHHAANNLNGFAAADGGDAAARPDPTGAEKILQNRPNGWEDTI